ncbi:MAG: hypothetical protein ACI9PP_001689 [Halobacteriales archaeon]|jgi:hypothetical protein
MTDQVCVWLVERTDSDDEQNLIILTYATPDGKRDFRKERALTSFTGKRRETDVCLDVDPRTSVPSRTPKRGSTTPPRPNGWPGSTTPTTCCNRGRYRRSS